MRLFARLLAMLAAAMLAAQPVAAQSILRDAETEAFLDEISAPLIEAAGLQPDNVDIILINDPSINAFVAGGQAVYIHSGLIDAADTAEEVQGVDRKSTRLNSSHVVISYAVFCLKKKRTKRSCPSLD